jgi:nucleotide-binding universal stress UspA family protein
MSAGPRVTVKNIVVTTDFSPAAEFALDYAISIARYFGSKIHLVHALHPLTRDASTALEASTAEAAAEAQLGAEAERCGAIECSQWVLKGTPLEVVDRILSFDRVDIVVVGTGSARGLKRAAAGSAAEHFFATCIALC